MAPTFDNTLGVIAIAGYVTAVYVNFYCGRSQCRLLHTSSLYGILCLQCHMFFLKPQRREIYLLKYSVSILYKNPFRNNRAHLVDIGKIIEVRTHQTYRGQRNLTRSTLPRETVKGKVRVRIYVIYQPQPRVTYPYRARRYSSTLPCPTIIILLGNR